MLGRQAICLHTSGTPTLPGGTLQRCANKYPEASSYALAACGFRHRDSKDWHWGRVKLIQRRVKVIQRRVKFIQRRVKLIQRRVKLIQRRVKLIQRRVKLIQRPRNIIQRRRNIIQPPVS